MQNSQNKNKLAQSASALGAGILGFGLGAKWGNLMSGYTTVVVIIGAVLHVAGMYVVQMKNNGRQSGTIAKWLWVSAWICLVILIVLLSYLIISNKF